MSSKFRVAQLCFAGLLQSGCLKLGILSTANQSARIQCSMAQPLSITILFSRRPFFLRNVIAKVLFLRRQLFIQDEQKNNFGPRNKTFLGIIGNSGSTLQITFKQHRGSLECKGHISSYQWPGVNVTNNSQHSYSILNYSSLIGCCK